MNLKWQIFEEETIEEIISQNSKTKTVKYKYVLMNATSHTIFELQIITTNSLRLLDNFFRYMFELLKKVFSNDQ